MDQSFDEHGNPEKASRREFIAGPKTPFFGKDVEWIGDDHGQDLSRPPSKLRGIGRYINIGRTPANKQQSAARGRTEGEQKAAVIANGFDSLATTGARVIHVRQDGNTVKVQYNYAHGIEKSGKVGKATYEPDSPNTLRVRIK